MGYQTRAEALADLDEIERLHGASGDVVSIFDPTDDANFWREMIHGTMGTSDRRHEDADIYSKTLTIEGLYG